MKFQLSKEHQTALWNSLALFDRDEMIINRKPNLNLTMHSS